MEARVGLGHLLDNFEDSWRTSYPSGAFFYVLLSCEWMDVAANGGRGNLLKGT
jgi:hypothetical protein